MTSMINPDDIDPEILDIIQDLNSLGLETLYSCAGYGEHSKRDIDLSLNRNFKFSHSTSAYISFGCDFENELFFELKKIAVEDRIIFASFSGPVVLRGVLYFTPHSTPVEQINTKWNQVRNIIKKFKK